MEITRIVDSVLHPPVVRWTGATCERTIVASVINDDFVDYFKVLVCSILKNNEWFNADWVFLFSEKWAPLSTANKECIRMIYPPAQFLCVDESLYSHYCETTPQRMWPALFSLECFKLKGVERVIYLDVDMLCLGDLSEIFGCWVPFASVPPGRDRAQKAKCARTFQRRLGLNTGLMIIGEEYLSNSVYERILRYPSGPVADQNVLNNYLRYLPLFCLPHKYNYHAEFFWDKYGQQDDVRLLHYAGAKPLDYPNLPRMKPWFDCRNSMACREGS